MSSFTFLHLEFEDTDLPAIQNDESISDCSKNSFMLNDGQCDDEVNTKQCRYDLGDCCLETREESVSCKKCECVLQGLTIKKQRVKKVNSVTITLIVEDHAFQSLYEQYRIQQFQFLSAEVPFIVVRNVSNIAMERTCTILCTDGFVKGVNSWQFQNGTCICTNITTDKVCSYSLKGNNLTGVSGDLGRYVVGIKASLITVKNCQSKKDICMKDKWY